jgi:hypothetical protein
METLHVPAWHVSVRREKNHPRRSPTFQAHQLNSGNFVLDYDKPKQVFDWHYATARRCLGEAAVKHLEITEQLCIGGVRLIGVPLDEYDQRICAPTVDFRFCMNAHEIDPEFPLRELNIVPDIAVRSIGHRMQLRFMEPKNLADRIPAAGSSVLRPYESEFV